MFQPRVVAELSQSSDIVAIAAHVLEELEARYTRLAPDAGRKQRGHCAPHQPVTLEELARCVERIQHDVEQLQLIQEAIEHRMESLEQQLRILPACIVRLDRRTAVTEAQLGLLDQPPELDHATSLGAVVVTSEAETVEQWLTVKEVARYLNVSESTVRRYVRQGRIKAVRLPGGRQLRLLLSEVLAQLPQGCSTVTSSSHSSLPGSLTG